MEDAAHHERPDRLATIRELRQSIGLLVLTASSLSAYIALGFVAVRLFAGR